MQRYGYDYTGGRRDPAAWGGGRGHRAGGWLRSPRGRPHRQVGRHDRPGPRYGDEYYYQGEYEAGYGGHPGTEASPHPRLGPGRRPLGMWRQGPRTRGRSGYGAPYRRG